MNFIALIIALTTLVTAGNLVAPVVQPRAALRSFKTDGCSNYPDGTILNPNKWRHCCVDHDLDYWAGGTSKQRLASDGRLFSCVAKTGEFTQAQLIYLGVRVGGGPLHETSYRWGYGWTQKRDYAPLTEEELELISAMLNFE